MLEFITKKLIWGALDIGLASHINSKISYQLKTAQDLAMMSHLHTYEGKKIAEIGGGTSRVLAYLAEKNYCSNIEKFEGKHIGPSAEVKLAKVDNIHAYIGDFDPLVEDSAFDILFSISVVEHIETDHLGKFFEDSLRVLKPGGQFIHAIDLYLTNTADVYHQNRLDVYRSWIHGNSRASPLSETCQDSAIFSTDMATNPDNILYGWNSLVPNLAELRSTAQSVSLLVAGYKR